MITTTLSRGGQGEKPTATQGAVVSQRPVLDSRTLLSGGSEVLIVHRGEAYVLRETRLGKLILTK